MATSYQGKQFGSKLHELRTRRGWRLEDLKNELRPLLREKGLVKGGSTQHLSEIERGAPVSVEVARVLDELFEQHGNLVRLLVRDRFPSSNAASSRAVDLHVLFPARVDGAIPRSPASNRESAWTLCPSVSIGSDATEQLHVFPFGVAVLHRHLELDSGPLRYAARRRHLEIATSPTAVADYLEAHGIDTMYVADDRPYGFSCFVLRRAGETEAIRRAIHALANPSVLWPAWKNGFLELAEADLAFGEDELLDDDMSLADAHGFDVPGSHVGSATWAAVAVHPLHEDSHIERLLLDMEIQLQAFWCYASYVERHALCSAGYETKFLMDGLRRLAAPDPLEHTAQRLLREALVKTSRVATVVEHATSALRLAS